MNLLVTPTAHPVHGIRRLLLSLEIYASYIRVRWLLRSNDARSAMPKLRRLHRAPTSPIAPEATVLTGQRLGWAVMRALTPLPTDSRCLFRSLTLTCLLERRGIESELVVAVRPAPFEAHAWVECRNIALLPPGQPGFERLAHL